MKKIYIKPEMTIVKLPVQTPILVTSLTELYDDQEDVIDNEDEIF